MTKICVVENGKIIGIINSINVETTRNGRNRFQGEGSHLVSNDTIWDLDGKVVDIVIRWSERVVSKADKMSFSLRDAWLRPKVIYYGDNYTIVEDFVFVSL